MEAQKLGSEETLGPYGGDWEMLLRAGGCWLWVSVVCVLSYDRVLLCSPS